MENYIDDSFSSDVINWQRQHGRHALPWQQTRDAYRIWLSEIMLQQTQVAAVIPYYQKFLQRFPDIYALAHAPSEEVMAHWSGLGYYTRARNLHRCAQQVVALYEGIFPADTLLLAELPGIGRSTAAAITAFAYGTRAAILDGNVKRVFARVFGVQGYPGERLIEQALWQRAEALLPQQGIEAYTQGLMDLGATLCTRSKPACNDCPLAHRCVALATGQVADLPVRKPKKTLPEKAAVIWLAVHQNRVLLEQRPDRGIWGGLLSLPELGEVSGLVPAMNDMDVSLKTAVAGFGKADNSYTKLTPFSHTFTHFRLHLHPYEIAVDDPVLLSPAQPYVWYETEKLANAPLPAPIKKLLLARFSPKEGELF